MSNILIKNAGHIATFNDKNEILKNQSIYIEDNIIKDIDNVSELEKKYKFNEIIDATDKVILPGFINNHHHIFQSLNHNVPYFQNNDIAIQIKILCELGMMHTNESAYAAAIMNMAKLMISGCSTTSDFMYVFPNGNNNIIEQYFKAANDIGIRLHIYRGSITKQKESLFPKEVQQETGTILKHCEEVIKKFHDNKRYSTHSVGGGPCTIFTDSSKTIEGYVELAQKYKILLQTHVSESVWENNYCQENYQKTPTQYLKDLDFIGPNTSFVHFIFPTDKDIEIVKKTNTKIVHCPISNIRSGGIAPIIKMLDMGIQIGLGVDGSAGNESSNMQTEIRFARYLQNGIEGYSYIQPYPALEMATKMGAKILNRDDLGSIKINNAADLAIFNPKVELSTSGTLADPIASITCCDPIKVDTLIINGQIKIKNKKFTNVNLPEIIDKANYYSQELLQKAGEQLTKQGILKSPQQIFQYN